MTRTIWTKDEKQKISRRLVEIFTATPWKTNPVALVEAQDVLHERRRLPATYGRVFNYKEILRVARKEALDLAKTKRVKEASETAVATNIAAPVLETKRGTTERLAAVFDEILDILADKVAERLQREAPRAEPNPVPPPFTRVKHNPEPPNAPREAKVGVLVIGLLGDQIEALPHYRDLDLTFLPTEQALSKDVIRRAHTILMTKFINHAVQEKYRKAPMLHYCNGGVTELGKLLMSIAIREDAKQ